MSIIGKYFEYASLARQLTGKSYVRQWVEAGWLAMGERRLGLSEYYELEIFNDAHFSAEQKVDCVGWRASDAIDKHLNHNYWRSTANDKVLNYALLAQYRFPAPQTLATYSPAGRRVGSELSLNTASELESFLTYGLYFPVFIKPIHGSYGRGTFLLTSYDATVAAFRDVHGKSLPLDVLMKACLTPQFSGMLFQECLEPHEEVRQWVGNATSCVRVIVALTDQGPKVHSTFWKIARAHNITDNFHMGSTGNLLAAVNSDTGLIERVVTGLWPGGKTVTTHPDTQQELTGQTLPDWKPAMDMCLSAATCFPGLKLQHWDVAFCRQGPVLMELNTEADLGVPQFLSRTPFVDPNVKQMMSK